MSEFPPDASVKVDGKVLRGEEFEEYCKDHGLCRKCAKVRTQRRVLKLFGRGKKWEPMTLHEEESGDFTVYKGFCLKPTCYTIGQAKRMLGEGGGGRKASGRRNRLSGGMKRRPGKRHTKSNPETGSVMSGVDDDMSIASEMSGMSQMSNFSNMSGMSGMSGFSGIGSAFRRGRRKKKRSSGGGSVASSVSSFDEDDDMTVESSANMTTPEEIEIGKPSPIVSHRLEQLVAYDYFTVLDLSKVELREEDVAAIVEALPKTKTLESVTLDKCKLKDDALVKIMAAMEAGNHIHLKKLSLRQNSIGNKGVQSLEFLLKASPTLEELELGENAISSRGASSVLTALAANPSLVLHTLNFSQNEIWDMDDGSFLKTNQTLKILNFDGNFMHDEGAEQISTAIIGNKGCCLEKLFLGWNGISDDGACALAKMMEANSTVQVIGLAENDISNAGARAILSALAVNTSIREISGLYHNQIDRKFIIVAIKRLLHRYGERTGQAVESDYEASLRENTAEKAPVLASPKAAGEQKTAVGDDSSSSSTNWATQMYTEEDSADDTLGSSFMSPSRKSVALEAIQTWDWGTFGIEEIDDAVEQEEGPIGPPPMTDCDGEDQEPVLKPSVPEDGAKVDRIKIFQSAPLAYFNPTTSEHHDVPLMDFEYEADELRAALIDTEDLGAEIEVSFESATRDTVSNFFAQGHSPIMHFSGHGQPDSLALENGFGYMQALEQADLQKITKKRSPTVKAVFISSCYPDYTANAFLRAGIKHVISCRRDAGFRDEGATEFAGEFYRELARDKSIQEAFDIAIEFMKTSPTVKNSRNIADRYKLLPATPSSVYHDKKIFFQNPVLEIPEVLEPDLTTLPAVPELFVGREVDMYEILESLRVDDVIRVGGGKGSGKKSVLSALGRYILDRPKSFGINSVFWLPAPEGIDAEPDSLHGDLCQVMKILIEAEDDLWDEDDYTECRERIMIELEEQKIILVIDGRLFTSEAAGENLERFLSHLLNEANVKIILVTAREAKSRSKRSRSEETMVMLGPLDFKSSALLFGDSCPHVSTTGNPTVHTAEEFADLLVPPSVRLQGVDRKELSRRQEELFERMGKGNPAAIIAAASSISLADFSDFLRFAQRPEVQVDSSELLKNEIAKRTSQKDKAIANKNFLRARDLNTTLEELEALKAKFPSLDDLKDKEKEFKKEFSELLKARKYDAANAVKRKILSLKKDMMKEKFAKPTAAPASEKLKHLQAKMDKMLAMAEQMKMDKSTHDADDAVAAEMQSKTSFALPAVSVDCVLSIRTGEVVEYSYTGGICGSVCWTNESCNLSITTAEKKVLEFGAHNLEDEMQSIPTVLDTEWGPVKCPMGEALIVGPRTFSKLVSRYVIFAASPLSPSNDDTEWDDAKNDVDALHYLDTGLRASVRSTFSKLKSTGVEAVAMPMISTKEDGATYRRSLLVTLQTVIEEAHFASLKAIDVFAASSEEAEILVKMVGSMGLSLQ